MARQIDGLKTELRELKAAMQEQGERFDELIEHLRGSQNLRRTPELCVEQGSCV